jgi:hypothetical protein
LSRQEEEQLVHGPPHAPGERGPLLRKTGVGYARHHRLRDSGQGPFVEIIEGERRQLLFNDGRELRNSGSELAGYVLPGLPQIREPLTQGLALRLRVCFVGHPG